MPMRRSSSKRSRMPPLTMSLRWITPSTKLSCATTSGVPPARATRSTSSSRRGGHAAALLLDPALDGVGGALAVPVAVHVDAAHPRRRGEGDEGRLVVAELAAAQAVASPSRARRSSGPRASRRRARRAGRPRRARVASTPSTAMNSEACRLPSVIVPVLSSSSTSTSPDASTARPDMASTLRCTSRSMPAMPIAESSAPIVVGISATSSAISTVSRRRACRRRSRTAAASRRRRGR